MFKLKSVVFIVFIIATCSVFGKIKKLNKGLLTQSIQGQVQGSTQVGIKDEGKKDEGKKDEGKKDEGKKDEGKREEGKREEEKKEEPKREEPKPELAEEVKEKVGEDLFLGADIGDDETPFDFEFRHFYDLLLSSYGEYPENYYFYYEDEENPEDPHKYFNEFVDYELWAIDRDGDGAVSYEEYLERLGQLAERYRIPVDFFTEEEVKAVFDHFNHNDEDEVLDHEEFSDLVQAVVGVLVGHFEHIDGTPLEKLFNLREYLQMIHYFLGPEGEVDDIPDLSHDEEERYDPLDWVFNVTKFFKYADSETPVPEEEQVVTIEDGRNVVDWFILGYIQANEKLREAVLGELKGDKPVDAREFKEAIKRALRKLAKALENKKDKLEEELHDLEEEELQAEVEGSASAQAFLKLKSAKKSRKMKKNLKNKTDLSKKTKKIKKTRMSKKIAMKK